MKVDSKGIDIQQTKNLIPFKKYIILSTKGIKKKSLYNGHHCYVRMCSKF